MNKRDQRQYDSLVRARTFCADGDNRPVFEKAPTGPQLLADLDTHIADMDRLDAAQLSGRGIVAQATVTRAATRAALVDSVDAIVKAARVAALQSPGVDRRFQSVPKRSDRSLVSWGRTFLSDAQSTIPALTAAGLPATVLENLPAQIDAMDKAIAATDDGRSKHVNARLAISQTQHAASETLDGLDVIAKSAFHGDALKVAAWKYERKQRPAASATPDAVKPAAPATTTDNKVA